MNKEIYAFLKKNHRLLNFEDNELKFLAELCKLEEFDKDAEIIQEGMLGDKIYFILEGEVGISKKIGDRSVFFIATLGIGEMLGEMSVLTNYPRSATAYASSPCKLVSFSKQSFELLKREKPDIFYKYNIVLTKVLAERLYKMEDRVTRILAASLSENIAT